MTASNFGIKAARRAAPFRSVPVYRRHGRGKLLLLAAGTVAAILALCYLSLVVGEPSDNGDGRKVTRSEQMQVGDAPAR